MASFQLSFALVAALLSTSAALFVPTTSNPLTNVIKLKSNGYVGLLLEFDQSVGAPKSCKEFFFNFEESFRNFSTILYGALDRRVYIQHMNVLLPRHWEQTNADCLSHLKAKSTVDYFKPHFIVGPTHPLFANNPWTEQGRGCSQHGNLIYISAPFFTDDSLNGWNRGHQIFRQWARFRYGIFDDQVCHGTRGSTTEFCRPAAHDPQSPSKHNRLCQGKSPVEVVLSSSDFSSGSQASIQSTKFTYWIVKRPAIVIAVDCAIQNVDQVWNLTSIAIESLFSFLDAETSLALMAYSNSVQILQQLRPVGQILQDNLPLMPLVGKSTGTSLPDKAVVKAASMLSQNGTSAKNNVFILITTGTVAEKSFNQTYDAATKHKLRLSVIHISQNKSAESADLVNRLKMVEKTGGLFRQVQVDATSVESEGKTNFTLVLGLQQALTSILKVPADVIPTKVPPVIYQALFWEHQTNDGEPTVEDSGEFYVDPYYGKAMIQVYIPERDDQDSLLEMEVSDGQLTYNVTDFNGFPSSSQPFLLWGPKSDSDLISPGSWNYTLLHKPMVQPRFVQVVAWDPTKTQLDIDFSTGQLEEQETLQVSLKFNYLPALKVQVKVLLESLFNRSVHSYSLLDDGIEPDVSRDDGVYSAKLPLKLQAKNYSVIILVDGNDESYTIKPDFRDNLTCCDNDVPDEAREPLGRFSIVYERPRPLDIEMNTFDNESVSTTPFSPIIINNSPPNHMSTDNSTGSPWTDDSFWFFSAAADGSPPLCFVHLLVVYAAFVFFLN